MHAEPVPSQDVRQHLIADEGGRLRRRAHHGQRAAKRLPPGLERPGHDGQPERGRDPRDAAPHVVAYDAQPEAGVLGAGDPPGEQGTDLTGAPGDDGIVQIQDDPADAAGLKGDQVDINDRRDL